ncbi:alpha/beta fold hydrolase [Couchioplanes caeruleus]|uniref:alpha/beta fold hydrolase n=1 Tax=Couchioplanes caeruleus TaxID=56438 RepID=UPI0020BDF1D8|nr:alpha/beta fold hydrolase [Couchioplanes caeruleus]UQU66773.1 alpha/beta fold hydrolase [Couchioplanes caeruleus]
MLRLALSAPRPYRGWVSRWSTVAGIRTHERVRARPVDALPVVMLHGLAVSHRYLMPTADALADRHPVLVPDLPGFGLSGRPGRAYDVEEHAAFVSAWLDAHGLDRVAVLGHSFGAEVAAALARRRPDAVAALVLASPTADPAARSRRGLVGRWFADLPGEVKRQAVILVRDVYDARPWRVWSTIGHSVHNRVEDDLRRISAPTLVLGGDRDTVAPLPWRTRVAQLTGGVSVTLPGAAHNALTTAGPAAADAIATHLAMPASAPR